MRFFARIRASLARMGKRNIDLIGLWFALLLAQQLVPPTNPLARDDLLPWLAVAMSGVALLRGRLLGPGPHPMLTRRRPEMSGWLHRASLAIAPWVICFTHDYARTWMPRDLGVATASAIALAVLLGLSAGWDQTAWTPRPGGGVLTWIGGTLLIGGVAAGTGLLRHYLGDAQVTRAISAGALLGIFFVAVGWVGGRAKNVRQRVRAGRKDGRRYRPPFFPSFLALVGPSVGLGVLFYVLPDLDFRFAFAGALLVVVWGAVIWPQPVPVAVACLLHEVHPVGGRDKVHPDSAKPFEQPPDGALRFNPLRTKRTRVMHAWYVAVQASRIADLDDPVKPLWPVPPPAVPYHILGNATFEPDPLTRSPQWDVLTVRMKSQEDTVAVSEGADAAMTRRMVILRPFPRTGIFGRRMTRTYRWDPRVPQEAVQVLDHTTESATLRTGDVLLLSTEGVAHAYEVEVGAPVYQAPGALNARPPQLGDYVAL